MSLREGLLVLASGEVFEGELIGAERAAGAPGSGEVVFNTALSGYQEIVTDPSYAGQIITFTYPHIGNYGVNATDFESRRPFCRGVVVRDLARRHSSWRADDSLDGLLRTWGVPGIAGIDTRRLTRVLRDHGAMPGALGAGPEAELLAAARAEPGTDGIDLVAQVTTPEPYFVDAHGNPVGTPGVGTASEIDAGRGGGTADIGVGGGRIAGGSDRHGLTASGADRAGAGSTVAGEEPAGEAEAVHRPYVVAYDFGIKRTILRNLATRFRVEVVPASTTAADVLARGPDGVFLANGPGDPASVPYAAEAIGQLLGNVPIFGICLGHQLLARAIGAETVKLPFGHHGANHPVRNLATGRVEITSQNHNFAVAADSLAGNGAEMTHVNLNDGVCEGLRVLDAPAFSVQHHPEAGPGPHDSHYLFDEFAARLGVLAQAGVA